MDLFARELLLPRHVAVDLHVTQGQTCSAVAARLGAPFEVIAQQMLDALLLPAFPVAAATELIEVPLNLKQQTAAAHRGAAFLLQAGPGTGKTRTLVARVESLLDDGVDPRRILLLTFSNKAAGEMAERIARRMPSRIITRYLNIHVESYPQFCRFHQNFVSSFPNILYTAAAGHGGFF